MSVTVTEGEDDAPSVAIGEVIAGKYRVDAILGRGGMGVVVAATHVELGTTFAIKRMAGGASASPEAAERFLREARAAAMIESEHVARVFDFGRLPGGAPFMVMERLTGEDLARVLERGPLPPADLARYALQACDALAEAHARGIVHRDLKPANLFLAQGRDGARTVKVLDFGISKLTRAPADSALTATGAVMGTLLYMSPEQIRSARDVDARSDIWAMGVVLYELATGQRPFDGESSTQILARVLERSPPPPSKLTPGLPAELDAIVLRCLQKDPAARYGDVAALARDLARLLPEGAALAERATRDLAAAPPTRADASVPPRRSSIRAAAGVMLAGLIAGLAGLAGSRRAAPPQAASAVSAAVAVVASTPPPDAVPLLDASTSAEVKPAPSSGADASQGPPPRATTSASARAPETRPQTRPTRRLEPPPRK